MTIDQAIEILERHNQWRRGADIEQGNPAEIGIAIDIVISVLKQMIAVSEECASYVNSKV